jgi:hypothetical protein
VLKHRVVHSDEALLCARADCGSSRVSRLRVDCRQGKMNESNCHQRGRTLRKFHHRRVHLTARWALVVANLDDLHLSA